MICLRILNLLDSVFYECTSIWLRNNFRNFPTLVFMTKFHIAGWGTNFRIRIKALIELISKSSCFEFWFRSLEYCKWRKAIKGENSNHIQPINLVLRLEYFRLFLFIHKTQILHVVNLNPCHLWSTDNMLDCLLMLLKTYK